MNKISVPLHAPSLACTRYRLQRKSQFDTLTARKTEMPSGAEAPEGISSFLG